MDLELLDGSEIIQAALLGDMIISIPDLTALGFRENW